MPAHSGTAHTVLYTHALTHTHSYSVICLEAHTALSHMYLVTTRGPESY